MQYQTASNMLKKMFLTLALFGALAFTINAQNIAVIDLNAILESQSDYKNAQIELDKLAAAWRQEIAQEYDKIKGMYNRYQAEQVLLSDDARSQKEEEIMAKEKEVRDLQKAKFGPEGALFAKRQELVQPIQERIYGAVEEYADERGYDLILDKSSAAGIIFSKDNVDKTDEIIKRL